MIKNRMKLITALGLILCLMVSVGFTVAYFTDYENARGGAVVDLSGRTEIEEEFDESNKIVTVKNTGDVDMVVRVIVLGDKEHMTVNTENNDDWVKGTNDDYWYYTKVVKAETGETTPLRIEVKGPVDPDDPIDFEIIVEHEAQRVTYDGDTVAIPEGWSIGSISAE